ncbi:hydroxymethylglutaryl-CoA lyase [Bacillus massiliigorillae]|uniref:hydroxymethylglutaryl-CoA lyase n=1 Tax=Bacillus massiliigorillae TaxID=1243664 RepID=UPI0003A3E7FC|nr:hydroxymethylglutaryl-CoA lyase [Bacillus massiliigorillae]
MNKKNIVIKEVGPRDGLQNEKEIISTGQKIQWIDLLSNTGLNYIEITSFVPPKWIPQLSDALEVAKGIKKKEGITYAALVPNLRGLESALEADMDEISLFMSASESHNLKNINKSINDTFPVLKDVAVSSIKAGKTVRAYVSTVFGCPYDGEVSIDKVRDICEQLFQYGVTEISLGDTIGVADPAKVEIVLGELSKHFNKSRIALHFHDTRGMALANILRAVDMGFTTFDSALGGLGGCPYAPGASGNVATDDLVHMLEKMGYHTGINEDLLQTAAVFIQNRIRKSLRSHQMAIYNTVK